VSRPYVHFSGSGKPLNQSQSPNKRSGTCINTWRCSPVWSQWISRAHTKVGGNRCSRAYNSELIPYSRKQLAALGGCQFVASNRPERNKHIQREAEPARMEPAVDELVESLSVQTRRFATIVPHVHSLSRSPDLSLNSTLLNCLRRKTICSRVLSRINLLNGMQEMVRRAACEILRFW
jgi:hypothetical protein